MPIFENRRIDERRCPSCGRQRPLDWFGPEVKEEMHDGKTKEVRRYRKYASCWKCRAIKSGRTESGKSAEVIINDELIG